MDNTTARAVSQEATEVPLLKSCYHLAAESDGFSVVASKVTAAVNVLIAAIAAVANVLVFQAIRKSNSLRPPSKLLLCNLVATDVGIASIAQPLFVHYLLLKSQGFSRTSCFEVSLGAVSGATLSCVSLMTMSAISIDRYLAFRFHLKYREAVTAKRICAVIGMIWLLAVLIAHTWLLDRVLYSTMVFINVPLQLLVTCLAYIRIYRGLRRLRKKIQDQTTASAQQQTTNTLDIAKYRRSATSMMWIYGIFILCYLPYVCVESIMGHFSSSILETFLSEFTITITYFNSCLNPFVYCLRLPEIRAAVFLRIRTICGRQS